MKRLFQKITGWVFFLSVFLVFSFYGVDGAGQDVSALIDSLGSPNPEVRYSAARKLSHLGAAAGPAVPALVRALEDRDRQVQKEAMLALRSIGSAAVPALISTLKHRDPEVREEAALALGKMGPAANRAIPALVGTLDDRERRVVDAAVYALRSIGKPAIPELERRATRGGDAALIAKTLIKKIAPN